MKMMVLTELLTLSLALSACGGGPVETREETAVVAEVSFAVETPIKEVMNAPALGDYGRLLFPAQDGYWSGETLEDLRLTWYSHIGGHGGDCQHTPGPHRRRGDQAVVIAWSLPHEVRQEVPHPVQDCHRGL